MAAVEIAAHEHGAGVRVDEGIVVGAVGLDLDPPGDPFEGVEEHAQYLRRAAERVRVLERFQGIRLQFSVVFLQYTGCRIFSGRYTPVRDAALARAMTGS